MIQRLYARRRLLLVAAHDILIAGLSFALAIGLRYWIRGEAIPEVPLWEGAALFASVAGVVFWRANLYRGIWHYASLDDLVAIAKAATAALLVFLALLFFVTRLENIPRGALLLQWPLLIALLAGPRLALRAWKEGNLRLSFERQAGGGVPVLLIGAGPQAELFIRAMNRRGADYRVVGLVDDKPTRQGRDIHGVRVMGTLAAIPDVVARLNDADRGPHRLILALEGIEGQRIRQLLDVADRLNLPLARLPRLTDFRKGDGATTVRPIDVEDLLGRPQKVLDRDAMAALIRGRRLLITGAGGTIGAELSRQIAALSPAELVLFDNGEHNLYTIDLELGEIRPDLRRFAILGDVRDRGRIDEVFRRFRPELVFHAAAFKHVPLAEANVAEAILTNAIGTRILAEACARSNVAVMVMVSTDKAVNPTGIMGAAKRIAEMTCQALNIASSATRFVVVRFGNVLGSTGSVVPLFQRQLAKGEPLTVTHPEASRYFMTAREAVELILQSAALPPLGADDRGKIFVLDMGQPVRILDLARQMIRLAGLRPDIDIPIVLTGLRPGEKLHEEVLHTSEDLVPTPKPGILLASPRSVAGRELWPMLDQLQAAAEARDEAGLIALILRLVPEFAGEGVAARTGFIRSVRS
jgi:O-antigen biosynthesis protein WbqV